MNSPARGILDWGDMSEQGTAQKLMEELELYEPDTVQDIVDIDYYGGLPPYEENK